MGMTKKQKEFYDEYKKSLAENVIPKKEAIQKRLLEQAKQKTWYQMNYNEKIAYLGQMVYQHEMALKEFGPVLGLVMEALTHQGIVEKKSEVKNGQTITNWRIKSNKKGITIQRKGEKERVI